MLWTLTATALSFTLAATQPAGLRVTLAEGVVSMEGDGVRTAGGRAEFVLADGTVIHVDRTTAVRVTAPGAIVLDHGRAIVRTAAGARLDVHAPYARVRLEPLGVYSLVVDASGGRLLVSVGRGYAALQTRYGTSIAIGDRQMAMMTSATSIPWATAFEPAGWDQFAAWSSSRAAAAWPAAAAASPAGAAGSPSGGVVTEPYPPPSPGCGTWWGHGSPCFVAPAPVHPAPRGRSPYAPIPPNYAPHYTPNYTPGFAVPAPPPPAPPPPTAAPPRPAPPPATAPPRPPLRGAPSAVRVPERPGSR